MLLVKKVNGIMCGYFILMFVLHGIVLVFIIMEKILVLTIEYYSMFKILFL